MTYPLPDRPTEKGLDTNGERKEGRGGVGGKEGRNGKKEEEETGRRDEGRKEGKETWRRKQRSYSPVLSPQ